MTIRAVLLGLVGTVALCAGMYYHDWMIQNTHLIGHFLPYFLYGGLILFVLLANPLLRRVSPRLTLSGRELAVVVAMLLFACGIAGMGLLRHFTYMLIMPHHYERSYTAWQGSPAKVEADDVRDLGALALALRDTVPQGDRLQGRSLSERLPDELRSILDGQHAVSDAHLQASILDGLNDVLADRTLASEPWVRQLRWSNAMRILMREDPAALTDLEVERLNRSILDAALAGALAPRKPGVVEQVPKQMLADPKRDPTWVLEGVVGGLSQGDEWISPQRVPWWAWTRALVFWVPVILAMSIGVIGLSLVLHQQWAHHEHLPYPIVAFAQSLLPGEGCLLSDTLRSRLFWLGALPVLAINLNNYATMWWPEFLINIKLWVNLIPLKEAFPLLTHGDTLYFTPRFYFAVIGITYFVSSSVSLSIGVAPLVYSILIGTFAAFGFPFQYHPMVASPPSSIQVGIYFGIFAVLLYTGRRYYLTVARRSLLLPARDAVASTAVWGARVFALAMALFVIQLVVVGVDWQLAVLFAAGCIMILVVSSRLLAETGFLCIGQLAFFPSTMLLGFLGARAVGIDQLLILMILSPVLLVPRESLLPFAATGICLVDRVRGRIGPLVAWGTAAVVLGMAVGVPVLIYIHYQFSSNKPMDWWANYIQVRMPFQTDVKLRVELAAQGVLEESAGISGWQHFTQAFPNQLHLTFFAVAFGVVLLLTFLRHRFTWWPFHPFLLVVMAMWTSGLFAASILIGCLIKVSVTKYGGASLYQKLKPLMVGIVAGELLGALIPAIIGTTYHVITGDRPPDYMVYPVFTWIKGQ